MARKDGAVKMQAGKPGGKNNVTPKLLGQLNDKPERGGAGAHRRIAGRLARVAERAGGEGREGLAPLPAF